MGIGYILGGALQGIGAGITAQGQAKAEAAAAQAKEDALMRREIALENLRNQNAIKRDQSQSGLRREEATHGAQLDDWKGARQNERTTKSQLTLADAKAQIDERMARLQSSLKMDEAKAASVRELYNNVYMANIEIGREQVAADGSLVIYNKAGREVSRSQPGMFTPPGSGDAPLTLPGRSGATQQPTARPATNSNRPPLTSFEG